MGHFIGDDYSDYTTNDLLVTLRKYIDFANISSLSIEDEIKAIISILIERELSAVRNRASEISEADNYQPSEIQIFLDGKEWLHIGRI